MKDRVPFSSLATVLPDEMLGQIQDHGIDPKDPDVVVCRKGAVDLKGKPLDPQEKEVLQYVSTRDIDRDGEVLNPDGVVLTEFKKAPQVLWGHDYSIPPIGSDRVIEKDGYGVRALTKYADTQLGNDIWLLRRDGHLNTSSVGFIPMKVVRKGDVGWSKLVDKLSKAWETTAEAFEKANAIIDKWLLLEHSDVAVPSNVNARTIAIGKDAEAKELQALCTKGFIKSDTAKAVILRFIEEITPKIPDPQDPLPEPDPPNCSISVIEVARVEPRIVSIIERTDRSLEDRTRSLVMLLRGQLE